MKETIPLIIFSLLIMWLIGSWGASLLGVGQQPFLSESATEVASIITSTPTSTSSPTRTPSPTSTQTQTPTPLPTNTPSATLSPTPTSSPTSTNIPTSIPIPLPTATPTPELVWQGRIVERTETGAGTIGVRAIYLKDHPVILYSGGFHSEPQLTGTKPEIGDFGAEFGGLGPGDYTVDLVGIAEFELTLEPGEFVLVEFWEDVVDSP